MKPNSLSDLELELERKGDFYSLVSLYLNRSSDLGFRQQAANARAHALLRNFSEANESIALLHANQSSLDIESKTVLLITEATLHRFSGRWKEAQRLGQSALNTAKEQGWNELAADAEFGIAISLIEQGRLFLGADIYQKIVSNSDVSDYRRGLALSNWSWVLWDLGRTDQFKEIISRIPSNYRGKHELFLALHEGNLKPIEDAINNGFCDSIRDQEFYLAHGILLGAVVLDSTGFKLQEKLRGSKIVEVFRTALKSIKIAERETALRCLRLLFPNDSQFVPKISPQGQQAESWRSDLENRFLDLLYEASSNGQNLEQRYKTTLNPILESHWWLRTPLIPKVIGDSSSGYRFEQDSPWSRALSSRLGFVSKTIPWEIPEIEIYPEKIVYQNRGNRLEYELKNSPISMRLLTIMATGQKAEFSKQEIHQQLTRSSYAPGIHDGRILKLLSRLESRMKSAGIPAFWQLPRNNKIVLKANLKLRPFLL